MALDLLIFAFALAAGVHGSRGGTALHLTGVLAILGGAGLGVLLARLAAMVLGATGDGTAIDGPRLFCGCFAALWLAIHAVGLGLRTGTGNVAAGASDRVLGGLMGLTHALLASVALSAVALVLAPSLRPQIVGHPLGRVADRGVDAVADHLAPSAPGLVDGGEPEGEPGTMRG